MSEYDKLLEKAHEDIEHKQDDPREIARIDKDWDLYRLYLKLGGKCSRCGFADMRAFCLHHKNGHGNVDRRRFKNHEEYIKYYRFAEETEQVLEILCANCHRILHRPKFGHGTSSYLENPRRIEN